MANLGTEIGPVVLSQVSGQRTIAVDAMDITDGNPATDTENACGKQDWPRSKATPRV